MQKQAYNHPMKKRKQQNAHLQDFFPTAPVPLVFGHRGCSFDFPENTLPAFQAALDRGIPAVELDVQMSSDGIPVIIHDYDTLRVTGIDRKVKETTAAELHALNAASFKEGCAATPIPTLEELFQLAGNRLIYDLEIKVQEKRYQCLKAVKELLKRYSLMEFALISSFDPLSVALATAMGFRATAVIYSKEDKLPRLLHNGFGRHISRCRLLKPGRDKVDISTQFRTQNPLLTWTVDDPEEAKSLIRRGVSGICSNRPGEILSAINT